MKFVKIMEWNLQKTRNKKDENHGIELTYIEKNTNIIITIL